jgi:thiamine pyrophosphokinase
MVKRINLMLGGPKELLPDNWQKAPGIWGAADRGSLFLLEHGIKPTFAVGDYDSLTAAEHQHVTAALADLRTYPPEKDFTDTQLCVLRALNDFNADEIVLYAATGGRMDHLLSNLLLATEDRFRAAHLRMVDRTNDIFFLQPGVHQVQAQAAYRYLGVVPLTAIEDLNISGAKYPLAHWNSGVPFSWASNEFLPGQDITICFASGTVALVYSRDLHGQKQDN